MGSFDFWAKKAQTEKKTGSSAPKQRKVISESDKEQFGKAWLLIAGVSQRDQGLKIMQELSDKDFHEATVVLGMFAEERKERMRLVKKAADMGNVEGIWEYTGFLPHSFCPDPNDADDALWEKYCLSAAEGGSVDAMNEMGNIFHRRKNYAEAMYWYAMANAHGQHDGKMSMNGIAREWSVAGCPSRFVKGSPKFDSARHRCAMTYLEICTGKDLSATPDDIVKLVLNGVPIAAYLAGDIFESIGNLEMAYKMYNAIAQENDPHGLKCYADMLVSGRGTEKDIESAVRFYQMAAERGEREAMFVMGEFCRSKYPNLAAYWYGLSHSRGYSPALTRLTQMAKR